MDESDIQNGPGRGTRRVIASAEPSQPKATVPPDASAKATAPWLVLGLGNAILCDDGVGIKAARYIAEMGENPDIVVKEAELAGFALIDLLEGFEHAVVIDAVRLRDGKPGDVFVFENSFLEPTMHLVAGHQIDLPTALEMGRRLGRPLPETVCIVGVQIEDDRTFSESCTPAVEEAIPTAAHIALRIVASGR